MEIKVKPEILRTSSDKIKKYGDRLNTLFNSINTTLSGLNSDWNGESYFAFEMEFRPLNAKMNKLSEHIQNISKNLNMVANEFELEDKGLANSIGSAFFLDFLSKRTTSNENIVVSGNHSSGHATRQFIEPAIKQIKDWEKEGKTNITWVLANSGYTEDQLKQIQETANGLGVHLMPITDKQDLFSYINSGEDVNGIVRNDRNYNKISDVSVFSHGIVNDGDTWALGLEQNDDLNITTSQLQNTEININAFSQNPYTWFASCNLGTVRNNTSFAQEWVNKVGGVEEAIAGGRTDYEDINEDSGILGKIKYKTVWRGEDLLRRHIQHEEFDANGCLNYPIKSSDSFEGGYPDWYKYVKGQKPEKIPEGGPRE